MHHLLTRLVLHKVWLRSETWIGFLSFFLSALWDSPAKCPLCTTRQPIHFLPLPFYLQKSLPISDVSFQRSCMRCMNCASVAATAHQLLANCTLLWFRFLLFNHIVVQG